jgi:hypothetical protein
MKLPPLVLAFVLLLPAGAIASNSLIEAKQSVAVAKSALMVTPDREWNKMGTRPGSNGETWTFDGAPLNDLTFYGGIVSGKTLFREVAKRTNPLPQFTSTMLITDVPSLLENSYRVALDTGLVVIDGVEPAAFAGHKGIRFAYNFTDADEVRRKGEGYAAIIGGRLYMITFEAPALHFFDSGIDAARAVVASAAFASRR